MGRGARPRRDRGKRSEQGGPPREPITEGADLLTTMVGVVVTSAGGQILKNCKLCKYSKVCNDLPGICILIPYVAIAVVVVALGYLFVTQEML